MFSYLPGDQPTRIDRSSRSQNDGHTYPIPYNHKRLIDDTFVGHDQMLVRILDDIDFDITVMRIWECAYLVMYSHLMRHSIC